MEHALPTMLDTFLPTLSTTTSVIFVAPIFGPFVFVNCKQNLPGIPALAVVKIISRAEIAKNTIAFFINISDVFVNKKSFYMVSTATLPT
jgi:hypothetical protein